MTVLVVNPPTLADIARIGLGGELAYFEFERRTAGAEGFRSFPGEHLGLMALTAACRARDIAIVAVNGQVAYHRALRETWVAMCDAVQGPPAVVGFSGPCQVFEENRWLAERAKERWPDAVVVFGHDFATLNFARLLDEYDVIDAVVVGEGERAFPDLCEAVLGGRDFAAVPGVATRGPHDRPLRAAPPSPLDLDELPWVARDHLEAVLRAGMSASVYTTRGCPYRCSYCTTGQTAGLLHKRLGYRERAVEDVVDEIELLCRDFDVGHLTLVDDLFVTKHGRSRERARRFADEVSRRGIHVPFMLDARLDSIDRPTFDALRRAGLHRVFVGIETGSTEQLAYYRKRYGEGAADARLVSRRIGILQELGVEVVPGIITYHPETTAAELEESLDAIDVCAYAGVFQFLNRVFVHPGTTLWHDYRRRDLLDEDWPVPSWQFVDPGAAVLEARVLDAVKLGCDFEEVRDVFAAEIAGWRDRSGTIATADSA